MRRRHFLPLLALALLPFAGCSTPATRQASGTPTWLPVWACSPQRSEGGNLPPPPGFNGQSLRQEIQLTHGGEGVRVTLDNSFGDHALRIAGASVARSLGDSRIRSEPPLALLFGGRGDVEVPTGGTATSDPVAMDVAAFERLAVTLHIADAPGRVTGHNGSRTTSHLAPGNQLNALEFPKKHTRVEHWYFLSRLETRTSPEASAIVVLGDSIADGRGSTTDGHNRWPDQLARRLQAAGMPLSVLNQGIGGNRVLERGLGPTALVRLERDVLGMPRARWVILHEGVNDLGEGATAEQLKEAFLQIIDRCRARGLRIAGGTIMPFGGSQYDTPEHERERQALNAWIRDSGAFDAVIDFDAAARNPEAPARLRKEVDGGDHLHPSAEGYRFMAESIELGIFSR